MSKERLEEAKLMARMLRLETRLPHNFPFDLVDWLIEQAELVGYFAQKNGELNEFLNKYIEPKHLGKNVIDVAMDIIVKQSERVQKLERKIERYREALEFYADEETYEMKFTANTDEIGVPLTVIELDEGKKARQALED